MRTKSPTTRTKLQRCRKERQCSEHSYHTIKVGDLYLYSCCPPWHDASCGKKWMVMAACLRCANEYGLHNSDTRKQLEEIEAKK